MFKKLGFITILQFAVLCVSALVSFLILRKVDLLFLDGAFNLSKFLHWSLFLYVFLMLVSNVVVTHKYTTGKLQEVLFFLSSELVIANFLSFMLYCLVRSRFRFTELDWLGFFDDMVCLDPLYYGILLGVFLAITLAYIFFIDKRFRLFFGHGGIRGNGKLNQVAANLENSRWMTNEEKKKIFKSYNYLALDKCKKDGIPVMAKMTSNKKDMEVMFNSPCHALVIGSTGSGKTTTFVSPMIQLIGATNAGSSMIMTDPKGELFQLHSGYLESRGYKVKVIDLRDTYSSSRWNPLDSIWDNYTLYRNAHKAAFARKGDPKKSGLKLVDPIEMFDSQKWYEFDGKGYATYANLVNAIKLFKKKIFDEVYEDLNDLVTVLIPVENEKDPMWEKGARSIALATLLAMLEDSEEERFNMTKDKFTFFNLAKILQNSNDDYKELRNYFKGRNPLSKAYALSKQVCDAATQTRASYMSIVYEKLTIFNDAGICALTSESEFNASEIADVKTALFLKIPDEKDTRHNLAAIFILNIYKSLIKVASAKESLSLDRNVYFIMDEFGNMPKIEKFDKFITVGRSRKIWFTMIVQSYAQLNNVYGETVADIVKGNCGIKMFIGSNDMATCKEYSELCGNISVVTTSSSSSVHSTDTNLSNQVQVRPLIYPSELQRLNHPGDIGHSIIVTFGNYPVKTYFTPSFNVPFYKNGKMDTSGNTERYFDENEGFYNVGIRNDLIMKPVGDELKLAPQLQEAKPTIESQNIEEELDNQVEESKDKKNKGTSKVSLDESELLEALRQWKENNEDGNLNDFISDMYNKNSDAA